VTVPKTIAAAASAARRLLLVFMVYPQGDAGDTPPRCRKQMNDALDPAPFGDANLLRYDVTLAPPLPRRP
ncbi:MAG: hypothetical protein ABI478_13090, partial [Propionivibrio sp.]